MPVFQILGFFAIGYGGSLVIYNILRSLLKTHRANVQKYDMGSRREAMLNRVREATQKTL